MRKVLLLLAFAALCFPFPSCGRHCIAIGGEYQGIDGNVEYCFESARSSELGIPVLKSAAGQKELYGFTEDQVNAINELLPPEVSVKAKEKSPVKKLLERINRGK